MPKKQSETDYNEMYCILINNSKKLGTDLVEASSHQPTCALCSALQGRIFSLSGKDKRFPRLPDEVKIYGGFHEGCKHGFFPFVFGASVMANGCKDPIGFSNRPIKDYRTKQEKEEYEHEQALIRAKAIARIEYSWIKVNLADLAPKSLSAYSRMKNAHTPHFVQIEEAAKEKGFEIQY